jgi:hypothetical protein
LISSSSIASAIIADKQARMRRTVFLESARDSRVSKDPPVHNTSRLNGHLLARGIWDLQNFKVMPTSPPEALFDPDFFKVQIKSILNSAVPMLEEIRNYGLALFSRCLIRPEGGDENSAILLPYLHLLEMLDAVIVLLPASAIGPSRLQLRSMLEASLTIEYVVQADTTRRGHAYLLLDALAEREFMKRLDAQTEEGRKLRAELGSESILAEFDKQFHSSDLHNGPQFPSALLEQPPYNEVWLEYNRLVKVKKMRPADIRWYCLFDGPRSIRQLAYILNRGAEYEFLYSPFSATAHVTAALRRQVEVSGPRAGTLRPLRDPREIFTVCRLSHALTIRATRLVLDYFRPDEAASVPASGIGGKLSHCSIGCTLSKRRSGSY